MTNMHRRTFLATAGITALTAGRAVSAPSASSYIYAYPTHRQWGVDIYGCTRLGAPPAGTTFGGTHGAIAQDNSGNLYVSTQSETGVLVYSSDGRLLRKIATTYPEIHSLVFAPEGAEEYLYATVQKGTPQENWLFLKMKTDGSVVLKTSVPMIAGRNG